MSSQQKSGLDSGGRKQAVLIGIRTFPSIPPGRGSPLAGCHNDVARVRECLLAFGFHAADIRVLVDRLADCKCPFCSGDVATENDPPTRAGIRAAVRGLTSNLGPDDLAVLYFSGHGSEIAGGGLHSGQRFQTLVPHDSGRGDASNRDITDWEIEGWIRALGRRTRHSTLIFDCCHSGGVTDLRSGVSKTVRRIEPDDRPDRDAYDPALRPQLRRRSELRRRSKQPSSTSEHRNQGATRGLGSPWRSRGGGRSVVVLASSAAHQLSSETVDEQGLAQGLFTHHLTRALERHRAEGGRELRWSDVFPEVAQRVNAENLAQQPRRQGDGPVFAPGVIDAEDVDPPEVIELEKLAVVVGIDYREEEEQDSSPGDPTHGFSPLRTPHHDAREVARVLRDVQGYTLVGLGTKSPEPLLGPKATRARIHRVLQRLASVKTKTYRETAVVLYFAGHGVVRTESDGRHTGYLIPWGADSEDPSTWLPMKDLRDQLVDGISDPDRLAAMGQRRPLRRLTSRHLLVILDCCFGGALAFDFFRSAGPPDRPIYYSEYRRFVEGNAWQMLTSASHNQQALDRNPSNPEALHSPFAQALVEALTTDGADGGRSSAASDRILTAGEIHHYVDRRLTEMGVDLQSPGLMALRPLRGQFVFHVPGYRPSPLPDPPLHPSANPWRQLDGSRGQAPNDATLWGREAETLELLEHFLELRRHPTLRGLLLVGPSASGRTSLVEAGLRPILAEPDRARRQLVAWSRRQRRSELLLVREDLVAVRSWIDARELDSALDEIAELTRRARSKKEQQDLESRTETVADSVRDWAERAGLGGRAEEALTAEHQRERLGVPSFSDDTETEDQPWIRRVGLLDLLDTPEILCRRLLLWRRRHGLADFFTISDRALRSLVGRWRWVTEPEESEPVEGEGVVQWIDTLEERLASRPPKEIFRLGEDGEYLVVATAGSGGPDGWRAVRAVVAEGSEESLWRIVHTSPPDRETLRAITREPAAAQVLDFDPPELVETLVESVHGTAAPLPLLSELLARMFDHAWTRRGRDGRTLTVADLPAQGVGGWLARRAERLRGALCRRDPELARTLRRLVLRSIRIEKETLRRRRVSWRELDLDDSEEHRRLHRVVIPALVRARLAVVDASGFELVADALLRHWPRLRRSLTARHRPGIRQKEGLLSLWRRAREWQNHDFDSEALWSRGSDLPRLLTAPGLNRIERGYVVASEIERRRRIQLQLATLAVREMVHDWPRAASMAVAAMRLALDSRDFGDRVLRSLEDSDWDPDSSQAESTVVATGTERARKLRGEDFLRVLQSLHEILSATPFSIPWSVSDGLHLRGLAFLDRSTLVARLGPEPLEGRTTEVEKLPSRDERFLVWNLDRPGDPPRFDVTIEGPPVAEGRVVPRPRGPLDPGEDFPTVGEPTGPRAQPDFDRSVRYFAPVPIPLPPALASRIRPPRALLGHRRVPNYLAFSPAGTWLATASDRRPAETDGIEIRIWPRVEGSLPEHPQTLPQDSLEAALESLRNGDDDVSDSPEGSTGSTDLTGSRVDPWSVECFPGRLMVADRWFEVDSEGKDSPHTLAFTDVSSGDRHELDLEPDPEFENLQPGEAATDPSTPPRSPWPPPKPPKLPPPPWHRRGLRQVRVDRRGRWLAVLLHTGEASIWRIDPGSVAAARGWWRVAATGEPSGPETVHCLAFAPQGNGRDVVLAAAAGSGRLWFLDGAGTWCPQAAAGTGFPTDLVWCPRGHQLALGYRDGSVRLWMEGVDLSEPALELRNRSSEGFAVRRLAFGTQGDSLVVELRQRYEPFTTRVDFYRLDPEILIRLAHGHAGRGLRVDELPAELRHELFVSEQEDGADRRPSQEYLGALGLPNPDSALRDVLPRDDVPRDGLLRDDVPREVTEAGDPEPIAARSPTARLHRFLSGVLSRWKRTTPREKP